MKLTSIATALSKELRSLKFAHPVAYVYNPLEYARLAHCEYLTKYGRGSGKVILLGMNPGPWGMAQTGVPFGEINIVRDWLGIEASIGKPPREHPKRTVDGFDCPRSEVSGRRLWGWARDTFKTPQRFFRRFFVANYCPLLFLEQSGRNRTPDRLPADENTSLFHACDSALRRMVDALDPSLVIGVGAFAEQRARAALAGCDVRVERILHPSPANPNANRGWSAQAVKELHKVGVSVP